MSSDSNRETLGLEGTLGVFREPRSGTTLDPSDPSSDAIGPYRLLQRIGEGGMGEVWLAEQEAPVSRRVALKVIKAGMDTRQVVARFELERQTLALMNHPAIARVFDAGSTPQGRPYFAMEYVPGMALTDHCDANKLSTQERLELFAQVCEGVQHAHQKAIIHRDLKPSNILVSHLGGKAQPKIIDFGIAKATGQQLTAKTLFTEVGAVIGTPEYMSPEQAEFTGDVDTRTDVYTLGVVLYQLLTGELPRRLSDRSASGYEEFRRKLRQDDPPRPSTKLRILETAAGNVARERSTDPGTLRRQIAGDLDAITLKALERDRARRYGTPSELAADLARHLRNEPVLARPPSAGYRFRKFLRRNKLALAAATAIGVSLIAGLSGALWQARRALAQAERAEQVKEFVLSIFENADTDSGAGSATTAADLLKTASKRVVNELAGRPELAVELMTAIGYSLLGQGETADAAALMHDAVDLSVKQLGPTHPLTGAARAVYGEALVELGRMAEAIAVLAPAVDTARRDGDLRTLIAALRWTSSAQISEGQLDEGIASAREAVAALSMKLGHGKAPGALVAMDAYLTLSNDLLSAHRPGALDAARQALAMARTIYGRQVVQPVLEVRTVLANAAINEEQVAEGLHELESMIPDAVGLLGPNHPKVAKIAYFVGRARLDAGDVRGAIPALRQSVAIVDTQGGANSALGRGATRMELGRAYAVARQPDQALPIFDAAVRLLQTGGEPQKLRTLQAMSSRASQLVQLGRLAEAEAEFGKLESADWSGLNLAANRARLAVLRSLQSRHRGLRRWPPFPRRTVQVAETRRAGCCARPARHRSTRCRRRPECVAAAAGRSASL